MDERPPKASRFTVDRGMPGAFEGETVTRRRLMTGTVHATGAIAAAAFTLPALGFAIAPIFSRPPITWQEMGALKGFPEFTYERIVFTIEPRIGEAGESLAYVRRHVVALDGPVKDRYDHIVAISDRCVHVGCPVRFVSAADTFVCPCHGGV